MGLALEDILTSVNSINFSDYSELFDHIFIMT